MAILRIYGRIVDGEESAWLGWAGVDHVTPGEVSRFIEGLTEEDDTIDLLINSCGGNVTDGWAIYDALRTSGKRITATVEGVCASMASIVYMAAPKEARYSMPHASFCIHEPRFPAYSIEVETTADMLSQLSDELRIETQRFIDLYAERTGADADAIATLMREDRIITAEEARDLGIVGVINTPNTANKSNLFNNLSMAKKNGIARLLERAAALLRGAVAELRLTTTDGTELVVDTDADDPRVGDSATPDGEHRLEDGRVVVVTDGVITEIREREVTEEEITEEEVQAMVTTIEQLTAEVERLNGELNSLQASRRTAEDIAILDTVAKAGGKEWLDAVAVSKRSASQRTQLNGANAEGLSFVEQKLEAIRNKNKK